MNNVLLPCIQKKISRLGLGTVKLGRDSQVKYPQPFAIPDDKQALALLEQAAQLGINLIDTAPAYGNSESRLGSLLPQIGNDWVVITKAGEQWRNGISRYDFTPDALRASVEKSLTRLRMQSVDIVLIHSNGDDVAIIEQDGVFDTMRELRAQGKLRAFGMSAKTRAGAELTLMQSDILMYELHHLVDDHTEIDAVMQYANKLNKPVLVKKAFASGHMVHNEAKTDAITHSFRYSFSFPATAAIISGTINPRHLRENAAVIDSLY